MKKSEMTITMPLISWNEYEEYKRRYENITSSLAECFNSLQGNQGTIVDFDAQKALKICMDYLPTSMRNASIEIRI